MTQLQTVKSTVEEFHLLSRDDSVLVALSGGPDSVALAHILTKLRDEYRLSLAAVYINHNIRKRAAKSEAKFCAGLCEKLGIRFFLESGDMPALARKRRAGLEETAREFRYAVFERLAKEHSFDRIALGHHADDQAETVLFRVIRGTGISGLSGIPVSRGKIIRPLLKLRRQDILAYLDKHRLEYCTDQSNATVDFARNYIRNRLLPQIRDRLNPSVETALTNLAATAADENECLSKIAERKFKQLVAATVGGKLRISRDRLLEQDVWVRRRVLRHCLSMRSVDRMPPDRLSVLRLEQLALDGQGEVSLPGKLQAAVRNSEIIIYRKGKTEFELPLMAGRATELPMSGLIFSIKVLHYTNQRMRQRRSSKINIDSSSVVPPLCVRSIRAGDRFTPLGMRGSKKIGDYLTDRKVNRILRDEIPVVCDKKGIIWLVGHEIADRVKITEDTREVIEIEVAQQSKREHEAV